MRAVVWRSSLLRLPKQQRIRVQNQRFHALTRQTVAVRPSHEFLGTRKTFRHYSTTSDGPDVKDSTGSVADGTAEKVTGRGPAGRRLARGGRARQGIPPPPPIPEWFLKYNVRLQKDFSESGVSPPEKPYNTLSLVNTETGAIVISFPNTRQKGDTENKASSEADTGPRRPPTNFFDQSIPVASAESIAGSGVSQDAKSSSRRHMATAVDRLAKKLGEDSALASFNNFSPQDDQKLRQEAMLRLLQDADFMKDIEQVLEKDGSRPPNEDEWGRLTRLVHETLSKQFGYVATPKQTDTASRDGPKLDNTEPARKNPESQMDGQRPSNFNEIGQNMPERGSMEEDFERQMEPHFWARLHAQCLLYSAFTLKSDALEITPFKNFIFHSLDQHAHEDLDEFIEATADLVRSNVIRLDANDIAELAGEYVDGANRANGKRGSISTLAYDVYDGEEAFPSPTLTGSVTGNSEDPGSEDPASSETAGLNINMPPAHGNSDLDLRTFINQNKSLLTRALGGTDHMSLSLDIPSESSHGDEKELKDGTHTLDHWQELKLEAFLEHLLNAPSAKTSADLSGIPENVLRRAFRHHSSRIPFPNLMLKDRMRPSLTSRLLHLRIESKLERWVGDSMQFRPPLNDVQAPGLGKIIHVRDIGQIYDTPQGEIVLRRLVKAVSKRRNDGERIIIVGTSASTATPISGLTSADDDEDLGFKTLAVPCLRPYTDKDLPPQRRSADSKQRADNSKVKVNGYRKLRLINFRNIQDMMLQLGVPCSEDTFAKPARVMPGINRLANAVLSSTEVQRIVLFANGFRALYTKNPTLELFHISLAMNLLETVDFSAAHGTDFHVMKELSTSTSTETLDKTNSREKHPTNRLDLEQLKTACSKHEQRLLGGVVDPRNIKTTFAQVHAPAETIEALKTVTTLALLRPDAFKYGVLANDRLPGLLLYGPPGTGKTLLAKAVAKESGATVLEVSGAQVYEKYVGEGEKMVKAVFSLAKKLSPCVVFIDEADALFGSRGQAHRNTHREMINQFLREWDGMEDHSAFIMVATNRPFDLDDAVLRRLPRRILVDLPTVKDRESILGIHLQGEKLDEPVSLSDLAEQTPFYSGSDLKNLCVAAALAAVREESELLARHTDDKGYKLPERRTLTSKHFEKAIQEISASVNEDMGSLNAIKKFDEKYGDRRGRKKKSGYGFGSAVAEDEGAARVRRDDPKP